MEFFFLLFVSVLGRVLKMYFPLVLGALVFSGVVGALVASLRTANVWVGAGWGVGIGAVGALIVAVIVTLSALNAP